MVDLSKAKIFKGKYEAKLEFPEGAGKGAETPSVGEVWIFFGTKYVYSTIPSFRTPREKNCFKELGV